MLAKRVVGTSEVNRPDRAGSESQKRQSVFKNLCTYFVDVVVDAKCSWGILIDLKSPGPGNASLRDTRNAALVRTLVQYLGT